MPELLLAEGLTAGYGDSIVLEDVVASSWRRARASRCSAATASARPRLLLTLMGLTRLQQGRVVFNGDDLTHVPTFRRAHAGLGWVPQERFMFPSLTVEEHLTVVARAGGPWNLRARLQDFPAPGRAHGATWATSCRAASSRCSRSRER